jgi:hypothetical protein
MHQTRPVTARSKHKTAAYHTQSLDCAWGRDGAPMLSAVQSDAPVQVDCNCLLPMQPCKKFTISSGTIRFQVLLVSELGDRFVTHAIG